MRTSALQSIVRLLSSSSRDYCEHHNGMLALQPVRRASLYSTVKLELAMHRSLLLLPLFLAAATLAGCGQKGPLTMPARPATGSTTPRPAAPATVPDNPTPSSAYQPR
jgi:predicted small lipoprotein YifL